MCGSRLAVLPAGSLHVKNIFASGELDPARTVAEFTTVQTTEGGAIGGPDFEFVGRPQGLSANNRSTWPLAEKL
jgi:hypothetical protein